MLLSLYACKSAIPEDLSARIVERKYVLTLHIQLNDFQSCCRHWRRQNNCENEISPKMFQARELTGLQSGTPLATPLFLQKRRPWALDGT